MIKIRPGLLLSKAQGNKAGKAIYEQVKTVWFSHKNNTKNTLCVSPVFLVISPETQSIK